MKDDFESDSQDKPVDVESEEEHPDDDGEAPPKKEKKKTEAVVE